MREYEVKVTRADFFADADKAQEFGSRWTRDGRTPADVRKKHDLLAAGDARGPSAFWYVTPPGLVAPHEVPVWAGVIEITEHQPDEYRPRVYYTEREITPAPRLHREKCSDAVRKHALGVCYWRMHDLLGRKAA